jgi:hypothetical protein
VIQRVDLGPCAAYEYENDGPTAVVLPGAMLGGMPAVWWAIEPLHASGWRVLLLWWEYVDRSQDHVAWVRERLEAAGSHDLVVGKSLGCYAAPVETPGIWLTPNLASDELFEAFKRSGPSLFVGGTADPMWDGARARELGEVLELEGADHGLARTDQAQQIVDAVAEFSGALRRA